MYAELVQEKNRQRATVNWNNEIISTIRRKGGGFCLETYMRSPSATLIAASAKAEGIITWQPLPRGASPCR